MKKAYLLLLAGMLSMAVFAGSKQTVKIDGQVIEKTVSEITFDGDNVVLQYSDNTSDQADMLLVTLSFTYQTTGISQVEDIKQALQGKVYTLQGQCVASSLQGLSKGVYIINGKKVIIK
jgi:hypothetical protein